jgi:TonB family protein
MIDLLSIANFIAWCEQVALLVVLCAAAAYGLRLTAGVQFVFWRTLLVVCLALPIVQPWRATHVMLTVSLTKAAAGGASAIGDVRSWTLPWPDLLLVAIAAGAAGRLAWTAIGVIRLRRLRAGGVRADTDAPAIVAELRHTIGVDAEIRWADRLRQPVTFGLRRPVVLIPQSLRRQPEDVQRAVIAHELLHVRRRDWAWLVVEEVLRGVFWFHPALWWVISRLQLAREAVVDELSVLATGDRRAYLRALLACAEDRSIAGATAFARRRHLFYRLLLISKEGSMSSTRVAVSCAVLIVALAAGGWSAVSAFPLLTVGAAAPPSVQNAAAPSQTPALPRRLVYVAPAYPSDAAAVSARGSAVVAVTIDASGHVTECRVTSSTAFVDVVPKPTGEYLAALGNSFGNAAIEAIRQWQYEPRADAPLTFAVTLTFAPDAWDETEAAKALKVGGAIKPPIKTKDVRPAYPQDAKRNHVQGVVILQALIGADGKVSAARVLRSIPELDEAALEAVRQWEFVPTLMNGAPVPLVMTVTINFTEQ